jgi:hypothetical protein
MRLPRSTLWPMIAMLFTFAAAPPVNAHNRSQSFSQWTISDSVISTVFTTKAREVTRLQTSSSERLDTLLSDHISATVMVFQNDIECPVISPAISVPAKSGFISAALGFDCPSISDPISIRVNSFFTNASSHVHYARVGVNGQPPLEYLFTDSHRQRSVIKKSDSVSSLYDTIIQYAALGIEHIFGGLDHIAFLVALLLLITGLKQVVWLISGFTLGPSITLSAAVMGWVVPDLPAIEALIGYTIAIVAAENIGIITGKTRKIGLLAMLGLILIAVLNFSLSIGLSLLSMFGLALFTYAYLGTDNRARTLSSRPWLAIAFGLIHGFGFASAMIEIGLPSDQIWPALLGFNVGIEIGQLAIVFGLWLLVLVVRKNISWLRIRLVVDLLSASLCGLGIYWFISRSYEIL